MFSVSLVGAGMSDGLMLGRDGARDEQLFKIVATTGGGILSLTKFHSLFSENLVFDYYFCYRLYVFLFPLLFLYVYKKKMSFKWFDCLMPWLLVATWIVLGVFWGKSAFVFMVIEPVIVASLVLVYVTLRMGMLMVKNVRYINMLGVVLLLCFILVHALLPIVGN